MQYDFYLVGGYGWSGSSALVDLLKEYNSVVEPNVEFRLIKDPYGINDLYNALVLKGDQLNIDIALKDFWWFVNKLNYKPVRMDLRAGLEYSDSIGANFLEMTRKYMDSLMDYKYELHWWMFDFKMSRYELFKQKFGSRVFKASKNQEAYFTAVDEDRFISATQGYLASLFEKTANETGARHIVLDQAVSVMNFEQEMKFIPDSKLIIVDRDPRDIYTDLCEGGFLIGAELRETHEADKYVKWHKAWRRKADLLAGREDVMVIAFEDLVLNYEDTIRRVEGFLGLSESDHISKKEYFNPDVSKKNIGIWKRYMNEKELEIMKRELGDYFYEKQPE